MFFKFLIGIILFSALPESDGWVAVEKVPKAEEMMTDIDPSIWVLFSKNLGSENILIRFPKDPVYRTIDGGGFIARVAVGGEVFELSVRKGGELESVTDRLYELDGKWVHEHRVQRGEHQHLLRTYSMLPESSRHSEFISSFIVSS